MINCIDQPNIDLHGVVFQIIMILIKKDPAIS